VIVHEERAGLVVLRAERERKLGAQLQPSAE
jgi:hypothetical protein